MKNYIIITTALLITFIACKKEDNIIDTPISTWEDTQKVKVLKVEILVNNISGINTGLEYEYFYDVLGNLINIKSKTRFDSLSHLVDNKNGFLLDYSFDYCLGLNWMFHSNSIQINNNKVEKIEGTYNWNLFCFKNEFDLAKRISNFNYNSNGLLKSITNKVVGFGVLPDSNGSEIILQSYSGNELTKYHVKSFQSLDTNNLEIMEDYSVNVQYTGANDIPDGLRRMVNQAILGLNSIGFEEFVFIPEFQDAHPIKYSVFGDWWVAFGFTEMQVLPAQNAGLVSSKQILGKRVNYIDGGEYYFTEVDSTAHFPYIHDAEAKTLEIAGLKIWYEYVD